MREPLRIIGEITDTLKLLDFDAIAVCGTSGLILATPVTLALNKQLVIVRKAGEALHSHAEEQVEADTIDKIQSFVILDDLVSTGKTVCHILKTVREEGLWGSCMGVYAYNTRQLWKPSDELFQQWTGTGVYDKPLWEMMEKNPPKWQSEKLINA
jgi:orotate phosphoribosyltransferase